MAAVSTSMRSTLEPRPNRETGFSGHIRYTDRRDWTPLWTPAIGLAHPPSRYSTTAAKLQSQQLTSSSILCFTVWAVDNDTGVNYKTESPGHAEYLGNIWDTYEKILAGEVPSNIPHFVGVLDFPRGLQIAGICRRSAPVGSDYFLAAPNMAAGPVSETALDRTSRIESRFETKSPLESGPKSKRDVSLLGNIRDTHEIILADEAPSRCPHFVHVLDFQRGAGWNGPFITQWDGRHSLDTRYLPNSACPMLTRGCSKSRSDLATQTSQVSIVTC